jgi:hypothetical protein
MVEKWTTRRNRIFKAGTIEFGGSAIDCIIRMYQTTVRLLCDCAAYSQPARALVIVRARSLTGDLARLSFRGGFFRRAPVSPIFDWPVRC